MRKVFIAVGVVVSFLVVTSHQSLAADVINGCYHKTTGKLRIVGGPSGCINNETAIFWDIQGTQGEPGPQGEQGEAGPAGVCDTAITDDLQDQINDMQKKIDDGDFPVIIWSGGCLSPPLGGDGDFIAPIGWTSIRPRIICRLNPMEHSQSKCPASTA